MLGTKFVLNVPRENLQMSKGTQLARHVSPDASLPRMHSYAQHAPQDNPHLVAKSIAMCVKLENPTPTWDNQHVPNANLDASPMRQGLSTAKIVRKERNKRVGASLPVTTVQLANIGTSSKKRLARHAGGGNFRIRLGNFCARIVS